MVSPSAVGPMASMKAGNSSARPIDAPLGQKSCSTACFQKVAKSGRVGTPVRIWTSASRSQRMILR